jgi:hypothetical protein
MPSKACDVKRVRLIPSAGITSHGQDVFALHKLSLYQHIEKAFGWRRALRACDLTAFIDQDYLSLMGGAVVVGHVGMKQDEASAHLPQSLIKPDLDHC